jgi:hypothetical protein
MSTCAFPGCHAPVFAGLGCCAEHVDRRLLVGEVLRLTSLLSATRAAVPESKRAKPETTILERM